MMQVVPIGNASKLPPVLWLVQRILLVCKHLKDGVVAIADLDECRGRVTVPCGDHEMEFLWKPKSFANHGDRKYVDVLELMIGGDGFPVNISNVIPMASLLNHDWSLKFAEYMGNRIIDVTVHGNAEKRAEGTWKDTDEISAEQVRQAAGKLAALDRKKLDRIHKKWNN